MEGDPLPLEVGYLPDLYVQKAEIELHETHESRTQGLRLMRELANEKSFADQDFSDEFLLKFLRARKFNAARALAVLKSYIEFKKKYPVVWNGILFENLAISVTDKFVYFLPFRCQDGCAILVIQLDNWIPDNFPVNDVKRVIVLFLVNALREPLTQVNGFKIIFDAKSNPIRHLRYCTPQNIYMMYHGTQNCLPGRFKSIHFVNSSWTFKTAWRIAKPLLSEKLKKRMHFHSDCSSLLNFFPVSVLPAQYGGELKDDNMSVEWLRAATQPENLATLI